MEKRCVHDGLPSILDFFSQFKPSKMCAVLCILLPLLLRHVVSSFVFACKQVDDGKKEAGTEKEEGFGDAKNTVDAKCGLCTHDAHL